MSIDQERLQRVLGGPALAALRQRLRRRYQRGLGSGEVQLSGLSPNERAALEGLLGRPMRHAVSMRLALAEMDQALARAGIAPGLSAALIALDGPLSDLVAQRAARTQAWAQVFAGVAEPRLRRLLDAAPGQSLLKRLSGSDPQCARSLCESAARVLQSLPGRGIPLARLAADVMGDAHALDESTAAASLVLAACVPGPDSTDDPESTRARNRWAQLGVIVGELSAPALLLNLSSETDSPAGRLAEKARQFGEPLHLSLRSLLRVPQRWRVRGREVFVCENPTIVAMAADRFGATCAPLICTDGMPSASQRILLLQLADAGARLLYHGDFDWAGIRIGNFVMRRFGARPWRFGAEDYRPRAGRPLQGEPVAASWDATLAPKMVQYGLALDQEGIAEILLDDLGAAGGAAGHG